MQECAGDEQVAGSIVVEDLAGEDAASKHEENCLTSATTAPVAQPGPNILWSEGIQAISDGV